MSSLATVHDDLRTDPHAVYARALEHVGADPGFRPPRLAEVVQGRGGDGGLTVEERREVFEYFRSDVDRLETMLGRDLSSWRC